MVISKKQFLKKYLCCFTAKKELVEQLIKQVSCSRLCSGEALGEPENHEVLALSPVVAPPCFVLLLNLEFLQGLLFLALMIRSKMLNHRYF